MGCVMINRIHLVHCILLASVFLMLCMRTTTVLSSASEMVPAPSNMTTVNRCIETERLALLVIKRGFVDKYGLLSSWESPQEEDCCQWSGVVCDTRIGHVTHLNLSYVDRNYDYDVINSLSNISWSLLELKDLKYLDLSWNDFSKQPIQKFIGSLLNLVYLDLSNANLGGAIPDEVGNLSRLNHLDLSFNYLRGSLPSFTRLQSMRTLYLRENKLSGNLPDFTGLQSLIRLYLDHNNFSGSLQDFTGCSSLQELRLEENEITEWKTQSIGQLTNLNSLDLSGNFLHSIITESQLSNPSSLWIMDASFNSLTFNLSSGWLPPFQLIELYLTSCKLGPKFPNWMRNQTHISLLTLSNSQISDTIPMWFWNISSTILVLDLSFNNIRGELSSKAFGIFELDPSSNNFSRQVPLISSQSLKINLSNNKFSGVLFSVSAVKDMNLTFLDYSHNLLSGMLANSWVHFQQLQYLNLGYNNFSGIIPISIGYLISLQTLILRNNSFGGGLPGSLRNCSDLGFADFGWNNLSGKVPEWIGKDLSQLYGLVLKSNKFYGSIPYHLCRLSKLQFLDLSRNRISGTVPPCFGNFTTMIQSGTEIAEHYYATVTFEYPRSYVDNALASWKGMEFEYGRNFAYLKMNDLSTNELTGEIPTEITRLINLKGLNLSRNMSRNKFHGKIPEEIGRLKMLESLDFSRNRFSGEIPQSMSGLNFLSYLDLSSNNFSGKISLGTQSKDLTFQYTRECQTMWPSTQKSMSGR